MKIRNRLFISITLAVFALILAFMFYFLRSLANDESARYQGKIALYAEMLPKLFASAMYNFDKSSIELLSSAVAEDPEINRIEIRGDIDEIFLIRTKSMGGKLTESTLTASKDGVNVGTLILEYSDALIQARIRQTLLYYVAMFAALLAVLGAVVFWTSFSITRPLYQIIDLVRRISAGQPEGDATITAQGELATLLNAIRNMRTELIEREASILQARNEAFANDMAITLGKQQLELERVAHQKTEALREQLQLALDDLQNTKEHLLMSEKMASLGSLVAGISHEINTPIGNSLVTATFLHDRSQEFLPLVGAGAIKRSKFEEYLQTVAASTDLISINLQRAAELIHSFKQVSVDQTSDAERSFNLNAYLASIVQSLAHQFKNTAFRISIDCPAGICIRSHPGAISQVLTNFIMNSLTHGFRKRSEGVISIQVRSIEPATLEILYADDGSGMDAENLAHHFEPFYTTLRNQGGSGLGAYIAYNLVTQRLKGTISVDSAPDQGIRYSIRFPAQFTDLDTCA